MSQTNWRSFITDAKTHAHDPQKLTEQQILTEGALSSATWEFCQYIARYITGVLFVVVVFFAWLITATILRPIAAILGFMGDVPMLISEMIKEIKKAQQIYTTKKELSPEEIERVKIAAQRVYDSLSSRGKFMVTRYSNRLSSMDLNSPESQDEAAKMVIALKGIVAKKEASQ